LTTLFEGATTKRDRSQDESLPVEERLKRHIIDGERIGLEEQLIKGLEKYPPLEIVNTFLLEGMKVVENSSALGKCNCLCVAIS
jgi:5-methyltetrahydrofolate--homocysteine methyltransferase